ncbi:LemA family protein [uncultured Clostridium sp.]|uniref:LemA family protein n=1 Tax=uncultured Clostridium sp. TaxID=59620 RepID=UPI0028EABD16|nr:LemA family protein [uncultured Clostridium sp.]
MNKTLRNILIVIGVLILLISPVISSYNKMVGLEQKVKTAESNIESDLQRRSDLIPNLVETVKGFAKQEQQILADVTSARAKLGGANTVNERANADSELSGALSRLLVVVENYPELKSNENFRSLMVQLEGTENRINIARKDYNATVAEYNSKIVKFPSSVVASIFRFEEKQYYKATEGAKEVPKVDFNTGK